MYGRTRYIVITLVIILVFLLGLLLFRGGKKSNSSTDKSTAAAPPKTISSYNTPSSFVRITMNGQVNSETKHRMIRVTIAQDQTNLDVFQGYQYQILSSNTYNSNPSAYNDFLNALQNGGFDKDRKTKQPNDAGMCPLGIRYIYEVFDNNKQVSRRWAASCGGMGTYGGNMSLTNTLFKNQIPDYSKLTSGVSL